MSSAIVNPNIKKWDSILTPFIITIMCLDDEGKRISNRQLYIKYNITYDGTEALIDSPNTQTLYSNKDGVIEIHLEKRACHISINVYRVRLFDKYLDLDDEGIDYVEEVLCSNAFIPFEPYIIKMDAIYKNDMALAVGNPIALKDIEINLEYSNVTVSTHKASELENCYIEPTTIQNAGDNKVSVYLRDLLLDKIWKYDIIVLGKSKELEIIATYTGKRKQIQSFVIKNEVTVVIKYFNGFEIYQELLDQDQWEFTEYPQINASNLGLFTIVHNDLTTQIKVPYQNISSEYWLDAWYEGLPVKVGKNYIPDNFRIYLWYKTQSKMLKYTDCSISPDSLQMTSPGLKWYTVTYTIDGWHLKDKVAIWCVEEDDLPDIDFTVLYFNESLKVYDDVTYRFDECTKINDERYINWGKILTIIEKDKVYGKYKLIAAPLTGLSTRFITEWNIYCDSKKGLRAMFVASYKTKEDFENGCKEENGGSTTVNN